MNKEFIPYEQALELKILGFDEKCAGRYLNTSGKKDALFTLEETSIEFCEKVFMHDKIFILAPLYQQAFRWFREKYKLEYSNLSSQFPHNYYEYHIYAHKAQDIWKREYRSELIWHGRLDTYEEAELACLKKLIEIAKKNKTYNYEQRIYSL